MPFFKSLPQNAGPPNIFTDYPELYAPWSEMSQVLITVLRRSVVRNAN
jgi:hypothetical protein